MPNSPKESASMVGIKTLARKNAIKRVLDLIAVALAAPVALPVMLVVAAAIRVIDGRPILFRQKRLGMDEKTFDILKFRTMRTDNQLLSDHQRITKLGQWLRRTSLDELPQLLNIVRGDMSLVGPRPLYPHYLPHYSELERTRHLVRPGITGLAQVSGRNGLRWKSRLALDTQYVSQISLREDISIMIRTVAQVRNGEGVSVVARDTGEPLNVERSYPRNDGYALRRFNALDIATRVEWMNASETAKYMSFPADITEASTREWYARSSVDPWRDDFVVCEEATEKVVSMLGLKSEPGIQDGVLYIFVDPNSHGQGVGKKSLHLLLEWAASSRYERVSLTVDARNSAAIRVYDSVGFVAGMTNDSRLTYWKEVKS